MSPDEDESFLVKPCDVKPFREDQETKSSFKSLSTGRHLEKKSKVIWTKDLHNKFLEAIGKLGIDKAVPKKIVELMKVDGLTRDHVASHLQKYRTLSKKIANANYGVRIASKPSFLESSMTNGTSWSHSSIILNQEQMNSTSCGIDAISPLILDTSSSCFPLLDASDFNSTNNGNFMQAMTKNLDEQRKFIDDTANLSVVTSVTSSNSGFVNFFHDYDGGSTEVQMHNNFGKGSIGGVQYSSNSSFVQNLNGFQNNYSSPKEFVEMGSLYDAESNSNLENMIGEDDMILSQVDIAYLLSFADDYQRPVNQSNQEVNMQNSSNMVSFYTNNEEHTPINQHQSLDGYLPSFDPTLEHMDEQFMPIWSPDLLQTIRQFNA